MLQRLLSENRPLLADGATGTNLFAMGLTSGDSPELWNATHPERTMELHRQFVDAGADIILTNTFGANRRRLMLHDLQERTHELNALAVQNARKASAHAGRPVVIAGSVGPTGDLFAPLGALTEAEAVEIFAEQVAGLKAGGADVIWIETMSAFEEIRAAAMACARHAMPFTVTASFDTAGRTMMGIVPARLASDTTSLVPAPLAVGANCGVGATDLLASVLAMSAAHPAAILIAKANCGIPQWHGTHIHYSGTPELMADYARLAVDAGARIIGGCCGTSPAHLAAMRRALDTHVRGLRPLLEEVIARTGALAQPISGDEVAAPKRARRRS